MLTQPPKHEGGDGPPREGGAWDRSNRHGACLGARKQSDESGEGSRLALQREQLPSHRSLLITSHSLKEKEKERKKGGKKAQMPELALFLGGNEHSRGKNDHTVPGRSQKHKSPRCEPGGGPKASPRLQYQGRCPASESSPVLPSQSCPKHVCPLVRSWGHW